MPPEAFTSEEDEVQECETKVSTLEVACWSEISSRVAMLKDIFVGNDCDVDSYWIDWLQSIHRTIDLKL